MEPTRFRLGQTPLLLDLIITSNIRDPLGKCDHATLYFSVNNQKIKVIVNDKKYNYNEMDVERLTNLMLQKDCHGIFREDCNIDSAYDGYIETIKV